MRLEDKNFEQGEIIMKIKTYICEGYDPLFGPIRDMIDACSYQEAKEKFFNLHGIYALNVDLER